MNFTHPAVLIGLVLGSIPIIVYYLMRFRSLRLPWGADYILERALARRRKQLYLDQIILLALRAFLIMALVVAFARPRGKTLSGDTGGETLRIVVVDNSYSLLAGGGSGSPNRREAQRAALRTVISRWTPGERWSLYALGRQSAWVVDRQTVKSPEQCLAILDKLSVEETAVSLAGALEAVLAHGAGPDKKREIYLCTDDQAKAWEGAEKVTATTDANTRIFLITPPLAERRNLAVVSLEVSHERVLRGHPLAIYAKVRNFSDQEVKDAELTLLVDKAVTRTQRVRLPAGQQKLLRFDLRLDQPGPHLLTARTSPDALAYDNDLSAGVEVTADLNVLVLWEPSRQKTDKGDKIDKFYSCAPWLDLAARVLASKPASASAGNLRVTVRKAADCTLAVLAPQDVVVLDGAVPLNAELVATLQRYVEQGGGLLLAADQNYDQDAWRRLLGPARLLPALPRQVYNEKVGEKTFRTLSRGNFDAAVLRGFEEESDGDLSRVLFYTWTEFDPPAPGVEILARFNEGSPFALRQRFERGSVTLLAGGLNCGNNYLLACETMYPFLVHLFADAASASQYPRVVKPFTPVRYLTKADPVPVGALFAVGDPEPVSATLKPHANGVLVEYTPGASRSGAASLIVLRDAGQERVWLGVQGERADSDLTAWSATDHTRLSARFGWTEVTNEKELVEAIEADGQGVERYAWVVLVALLFAIGELLMGLRFV